MYTAVEMSQCIVPSTLNFLCLRSVSGELWVDLVHCVGDKRSKFPYTKDWIYPQLTWK